MKPEHYYLINFGEIFTLFFVMLGPLRALHPFLHETAGLTPQAKRKLAFQTGAIAWLAIVFAGWFGILVLSRWHVEPQVLLLSGGITFFLSSLQHIFKPTPQLLPVENPPTATDLALRVVISPYGMVGFIVLLTVSHDAERSMVIVGALTLVMILNILIMAFGKSTPDHKGRFPMRILGASLNTLQLGLALQLIVDALRQIGKVE